MDKSLMGNMRSRCSSVRMRRLHLPLPPIDEAVVKAIGAIEAAVVALEAQVKGLEEQVRQLTPQD